MLSLFLVESKRQWLTFKRYPVESIAGVVIFTIIFIGLFAGSKYLAGAGVQFGSRLDLVVAGYILWLVTTGLFAGPGALLLEDARLGIIEQLFVSPFNFAAFTAMRIFSGLVQHLMLIAILVVIISLITGSRLDYRWIEIVPFAGVILSTSGLGLAIAAYALLAKQVGAILSIGQFVLLSAVVTPVQNFGPWGPWLSAITPINPAAQLIQHQLANGYNASYGQLSIAIGNGVVYFLAGAYLLELASRRARRLASVGQF
ncbi:ABC transporter permease [Dyella subtropica]|uniref:ABC transporter permease n=1 Tax=Dyella subtropica TaxID=2992127 RepID=UPI00224D58C9|nr:ABC transporter permease [Dyella subtropica]